MNSSSPNSRRSAGTVPPPPPHEFFLVLPDGSCIPATPDTCRTVMKQVRGEARKQARIKRQDKAVELQMAIEDRAAAKRLLEELAETERDLFRYAARLRVRVRPNKPDTRTSPVEKRLTLSPMTRAPRGDRSCSASSWVTDDQGMRGVIWQQSYLGRKSPNFYRGAARDNWEYDVRDEAVMRDVAGEPVIISNMGADWVEIGAGWQAMEDASTRQNAKIQIRAIAPFDADMSENEMVCALRHFCETILEPLQLPYSAVIHRAPEGGDERNIHPHLAFSLRPMRRIEAYTWEIADVVRGELDGKDGVQMLRHLWAHSMSEAAERARGNRRYTGLGYGARGLDFEPGEHLGEVRSAMVRRQERVWAAERNRIKSQRNELRTIIRDAGRKIASLERVREAVIAEQQASTERTSKIMCAKHLLTSTSSPWHERVMSAKLRDAGKILSASSIPSAPPTRRGSAKAPPAQAPLTQAEAVKEAKFLEGSRAARPRSKLNLVAVPQDKQIDKVVVLTSSSRTRDRRQKVHSLQTSAGLTPIEALAPSNPPSPASPAIIAAAKRRRDTDQTMPVIDKLLTMVSNARRAQDRAAATEPAGASSRPVADTGFGPTQRQSQADVPLLTDDAISAMSAAPSNLPYTADRAIFERLRQADPYVWDNGMGSLELNWDTRKKLQVTEEQLATEIAQAVLRRMREDQQRIFALLVEHARSRPLDFKKFGKRPWPRDLEAGVLAQFDSWAEDDGFQSDLFLSVTSPVIDAHRDEEAQRRLEVQHNSLRASGKASNDQGCELASPVPEFKPRSFVGKVAPFDKNGKPTASLVELARIIGIRPDLVQRAKDGRPIAKEGAPAIVDDLIARWRDNDRVDELISMIANRSLEAGRPVWPKNIAAMLPAESRPRQRLVIPGLDSER